MWNNRNNDLEERISALESQQDARLGCLIAIAVLILALSLLFLKAIAYLLTFTSPIIPFIWAWYFCKRPKRFSFLKNLLKTYPWLPWLMVLIVLSLELIYVKFNWSEQIWNIAPFGKLYTNSFTWLGFFNILAGKLFLSITTTKTK
ncbi:MAG: hypothetical protein MUD14_00575 [Hydrococcus sp. Prado102]|jgi:hypothetical protein|nr:hypothetical protein [Hydrococcus sp. Prado102]